MNMKQTANWQSEIDQSGGSDSVLDISIDDVYRTCNIGKLFQHSKYLHKKSEKVNLNEW